MTRSIKNDAKVDPLALEFVVFVVFLFSFGLSKKHIYVFKMDYRVNTFLIECFVQL